MYARTNYAFSKTITSLHGILGSKSGREILLAFVLTLVGFGAVQFAIDHDAANVYDPIITGFAKAIIFFFATVGFIAFASTLFVFAYYLTIGRQTLAYGRAFRIVFSFAISGLVTAAAFSLFYKGITETQFVETQYVPLSMTAFSDLDGFPDAHRWRFRRQGI
jgi:hypothetical protein